MATDTESNDGKVKNTQKKSDRRTNGRGNIGIDKRKAIISAAVKIFAENGFHNSKIAQIAKEAGVADGTIYLYFKNKDDILISLFEENMGLMLENLREGLASLTDPVQKLRWFIEFHMEMMNKYQDLGEVLTVELRQSHKFMKEYTPQKFADYLKILSDIICEGKDLGVFANHINPGITKRAIYGAIDELALNWMLAPKKKYELRAAARHISDIFISGMMVRERPSNRSK